jgi:hypothetical protein
MRVLVVVLCALGCGACMQETVRFAAKPEQQAIMRDGQPALVSTKPNSVVMVRPATRQFASGSRPTFVVGIHNLGKTPLEFRMRDVHANQVAGGTTVAMKVFTYDELVEEEKTRQVVAALLVGAAAGANAAVASQAGYRTHTTTVNSPTGTYSYRTTSYSPSAALAAQRRAVRQDEHMVDAAIKQGKANLNKLEHDVLKDDTLMPGEWYGGTLQIQPPADADGAKGPKTYSIALTVGPDTHQIDVLQDSAR